MGIIENFPLLIVIVIGIAVIAIFIMVILLLVIYMRRGKKKLPPADVIPEVSVISTLIIPL